MTRIGLWNLYIGIILGITLNCTRAASKAELAPFHVDYDQMSKWVSRTIAPDAYLYRFQRDSKGSVLFVTCAIPSTSEIKTAVITAQGINVVTSRKAVWFSDSGKELISFETNRYIFENRLTLVARRPGDTTNTLSIVPSIGEAFASLLVAGNSNWFVSSITNPTVSLFVLPSDFYPQKMFSCSNEVWIFGITSPQRTYRLIRYNFQDRNWRETLVRDLPWVEQVFDMDILHQNVILAGRSGPFPKHFVYNASKDTKRTVNLSAGQNWFLEPSLIEVVKSLK